MSLQLSIDISETSPANVQGSFFKFDNLSWRFKASGIPDSPKFHIEIDTLSTTDYYRLVDIKFYHINPDTLIIWQQELADEEFHENRKNSTIVRLNSIRDLLEFTDEKISTFYADITIKPTATLFDLPDPNLSDIQLIVGDKTFYCSKQILAYQSDKFYDMIYCSDKEVDQIEIENIDSRSFNSFLEVLYKNERGVKLCNIEAISALSVSYNAYQCLEACEKFIINHPLIATYQKLVYAHQFRFSRLQQHVIRTVKSREEIEALGEARKLSDSMRMAIDDRLLEIEGLLETIINSTTVHPENGTTINCQLTSDNIPFSVITTDKDDKKVIRVSCDWKDVSMDWECDTTISLIKNDKVIVSKNFKFVPTNKEITLSYDSDMDLKIDVHYTDLIFEPLSVINVSTDIVLSVGDKKFDVAKQILANSSSYFYAMFYGNFSEKYQTDIELIGIDKDDFEEFLQHVYNPARFIDKGTVDSLLNLSQMYDTPLITANCELFLIKTTEMHHVEKIELAHKYQLEKVLKSVVADIKTIENFRNFSKYCDFENFDSTTITNLTMCVLDTYQPKNEHRGIEIGQKEFDEFLSQYYQSSKFYDTKSTGIMKKLKISKLHDFFENWEIIRQIVDSPDIFEKTLSKIRTLQDFKTFSELEGFEELDSDLIAKITMFVLSGKVVNF